MARKGPKKDFEAYNYWKGLIDEWRSSGLSRREFCRKKKISLYSFDHYRYKTDLDPKIKTNKKATKKSSTPKLVKVNPSSRSNLPAMATIHLPDGTVIELSHISMDDIKKLL